VVAPVPPALLERLDTKVPREIWDPEELRELWERRDFLVLKVILVTLVLREKWYVAGLSMLLTVQCVFPIG
jgi:hypothetical protein